jgi:hypothetical protein
LLFEKVKGILNYLDEESNTLMNEEYLNQMSYDKN